MNSGGMIGAVRFGPFTVAYGRRLLLRNGEEVHLTPKAFALLTLLIDEAPRVVPKPEIHERLWPGTFIADATLVGVVKELRRALDDSDRDRPIVRTAHRVGYAFSAPIQAGRPPAAVSHWLVVQGRRVQLGPGENLIGRDPLAIVQLDSNSVSRRHARVTVGEDRVTIEDLGSKNGTSLGDARLTAPAALHDGDRIHIGPVTILYRTSSAGMSTETQMHRTPPTRPERPR